MAFDRHQRFDGCRRWTPGGEEGEIAIGDMTTDQQTSCPKTMIFVALMDSAGLQQKPSRPPVNRPEIRTSFSRQHLATSVAGESADPGIRSQMKHYRAVREN